MMMRSSSTSKMMLTDNEYPSELTFMDGDMKYSASLHMNFNDEFFSHCQLCGVSPSLLNHHPHPFYTLGITGVGVHASCAVHAAYLNSLKESKRINLPFSSLPPLPPPSYSTLYPHLQMTYNILLPNNYNYINGFQSYGQQPQLSGFQSYVQQPQYNYSSQLPGFQLNGQQTQLSGFQAYVQPRYASLQSPGFQLNGQQTQLYVQPQYASLQLPGFQLNGQQPQLSGFQSYVQPQYNGFPLDGFQRRYGNYNNYYYQAAAPAPKYTKYIVNAYHHTGDSNHTIIDNNNKNNNNNNSGYGGWKSLVFSFIKAVGERMFSPYY